VRPPKAVAPEPRKANIRLALAWFAAAALLLLADGIAKFQSPALGADTYYVVVHRSWTLSMPAAFGLFGALYLGMTPGFPVRLEPALGWAHLAVMTAGAAMTKAPQLALLWRGLPKRGEDVVETMQVWNQVATAGAVVMGLSLLIFFWALVDGVRRRGPS
jgi:heme/copper-type cytochrome/quinol oxidase subunit 1